MVTGSLTSFHYYIFLPGYGYNGILCGYCKIAVGVHWMKFVSHMKFRLMHSQRWVFQINALSAAARLECLATEFHDYAFPISLSMWNLKLCQQLKH